ncbi:MAG: NADH-quinone oxidoreductase subunit J [Myxococcales bacterium]|nr:NADH-quinone oxidoreductase subunit J [Myxococcales bacterium]
MISAIALGVLATLLLGSAVFVVRSKNLVHGVLGLGVTLSATAIVYAMLGASFLAGVQVLLYVGGVVTLMIFGVMVTRKHDGIAPTSESQSSWRGLLGGGGIFALLAWGILESDLPAAPVGEAPTTNDIAAALFGPYVLAFEALSLLLLAAIVGAIVIARRRDFGAPRAAPARPRRGGRRPRTSPPPARKRGTPTEATS